MRIVHYYQDVLRPSGVTRAIWGWQRAALDAGVDSVVLHSGRSDEWPLPNTQVKHIGSGRQFGVPLLWGALRDGDVLFLHEGWVSSNLVAAFQARAQRVPYVLVPHGVYEPAIISELNAPVRLRSLVERKMLGLASAVQVFYGSEARYVSQLSPNAKTISVATGMDLPPSSWSPGGQYLVWFGRYSPHHKGIDRMLYAYASIPVALRPPLQLRGVDYQCGRQVVEDLVVELGLTENVTVGGPIHGEDKARFLTGSAAFLFPSRWESQGIALLEALALGVPSVVSDSIHLASELEGSSAAVVADFSDPASAGACMLQAMNDKSLGLRARAYVERELAWDNQFNRLLLDLKRYI